MTEGRRYLVAPDKFKGTLSAPAAAAAIADGIRRADPGARIIAVPVADGGEGTVDAFESAGGTRVKVLVTGPLGAPVHASWVRYGDVAVIEMAQASGLRHVTPSPDAALRTDTRGTGELVAAALAARVPGIVLGVGGSTTTDGGFGALRALGARFLAADGAEVVDVEAAHTVRGLDRSGLHPGLAGVDLVVCADVLTPLTGPDGAAWVFAPQKGADAATVAALESRLRALGEVYAAQPGGADALAAGGAAGGLAAGAIAVLGARVQSGAEVVADVLGLDARIRDADVVVVGEGSLDAQSRMGKAPIGIARRARRLGVPAIAVVGVCALAPDTLRAEGIEVVSAAVDAAPDLAAALVDPAHYVARAAETAVRAFLVDPSAR
jgi:glycerate kinase